MWYFTKLPQEICDSLEKDISSFDDQFQNSTISNNCLIPKIRKSKNTWIPTTHWIYGFIWTYILKANQENFRYDITNIDHQSMQYTSYEDGDFYQWHTDDDSNHHSAFPIPISMSKGQLSEDYLTLQTEYSRKISFSLLLSDVNDYEGGNFQILDGKNSHFAPRQRGSLIIFDSRMPHRVLKVIKGQRKSLVGWCIGPRWK
jgi:PKHD-type hydroxylase